MLKSFQPERLLRICFWFGAVFDGLMLLPMLFPRIGGVLFGIAQFNPGRDYRYAMMVGASLMFGWTVLLIWAAQKPLERKGVLLLTVFPVLAGLILAGGYAVASGMIKIDRMIPSWIIQSILLCFYLFSYFATSNWEKLRKTGSAQK